MHSCQIITNNETLNKFLKEKGSDSKTLQELFLDYDQVTWDANKQARKIIKEYENLCKDLKFRQINIFKGLTNHLYTEIVFVERCKKILERKSNVIFIFEGYSYTYFAIPKAAVGFGYRCDDSESISRLRGNGIESVQADRNFLLLESKNKLNFVRTVFPLLKSNVSKNKLSLILDIGARLSSLAIRSISLKLSSAINIDSTKNLLKRVDKKLLSTHSQYSAKCAFFLSIGREDILIPFYMLFDKFKENDKKFQIFAVEPITSSFLSKKSMSFVDLFDEVYLLSNSLKRTKEAKVLNGQIEEIAIKHNLSILYIKQLHPYLLDIMYWSLAISIICDYIIKQMNLKSIVIIDGTIFGNSVISVSEKYKIPSFHIETLQVDANPATSEVFEADKICIYGTQGVDALLELGYNKNRMIVTGNPKYDYIKHSDSNKARKFLQDDHHIDGTKKLVVVAMSRWHKNDEEWMAKIIKFCNTNNFEIVIKNHPRYKVPTIETESKIKYIENACQNQKYIVTTDINLATLLSAADIVISDYSNVGAETILMGKPLLTFNFTKENLDNAQRYHEYGASIYTEDYDTLEKTMLEILNKKEHIEELKKGRQKIIDMYNYYNDGNATQRIFDLLTQKK